MKSTFYPFGYEQNREWSLYEGVHLFVDAHRIHSQHVLVIVNSSCMRK